MKKGFKPLSWLVLYHNPNADKIEYYNILKYREEFIKKLKLKLARLPKVELNERLNFYSEMIDDGVEEGLTEEEAVAKIGTVEEVALQVINEIPLSKIVKENIKPKENITDGFTIIKTLPTKPTISKLEILKSSFLLRLLNK